MRLQFLRLRFRRRLRKGQRQVEDLGSHAERQIERHLFKRFSRLAPVKRFLFGWLGLMLLLIVGLVMQNLSLSGYYQTLKPVPGGIYTEGVRGRFTNANPLYATTDADATVSRLIFSGLFTYDQRGRLTGDLASGYSADAHGMTYTVHLRPHLKWQDGEPLTSEDVVFTYNMIQNPDTQSPLENSWRGVTVTAPDARTVVFKLPDALASFPYNLTNGIVPKHVLANIPPSDLRSADFNTMHPVGAGPFAWQAVQVSGNGDPQTTSEQIALAPFAGYHGGGPKLQKFVVEVYPTETQLAQAFVNGRLTGAEGLSEVPAAVKNDSSVIVHYLPLRAANMVFFKTTSGVLADQQVRQAMVQAADVPRIISRLEYPTQPVREPLLPGQPGYDRALVQAPFNLKAAKNLLAADGWKAGKNGILTKGGQALTFGLSAADNAESRAVTRELIKDWRAAGADVKVELQNAADFQSALAYHSYDAVLDGISIGPDPDVFVYWDSSQADVRSANRLNLSEWKNSAADTSLEAGRTRVDPVLRAIKYKPFVQAWRQDAPALGLYEPRLLYLTQGPVAGLDSQGLTTATDRLDNVANWEIHQAKVTN